MRLNLLVYLGVAIALESVAAAPSSKSDTHPAQAYASYINFAAEDILGGDDGLPPHPLLPNYGKPTYPVTLDGNGREQVEAHLSYYEGKYWMYAATWGCGGSIFVYGLLNETFYPSSPVYPPGDYGADGNCGIKTYSSPDLTHWTLEDFYQPEMAVANVTKPLVRYSKATGNYILYMGGNGQKGNYFYATSKSPGGPWSYPPSVMAGAHINHDFDIAVGPDGTHYILSDVWSQGNVLDVSNAYGAPVWDIWVQQLAPNLTATIGTNDTAALIRTAEQLKAQGLSLEACGFFYYDSYWYLTFGYTCQNCNGYIYYYYSENPFGPYKDGGYISRDGCGGQNKGANVLPSANGPIVVAGNLGYRTSPADLVYNGKIWHADNHQAASSTYFFPLEFNADHTIKKLNCPAIAEIPLAENITTSPDAPVPYQLDCRVRNWQTIVQNFSPPKALSTLEFPVWQRTDNLATTMNAGPVLNGPLNVTVYFTEGGSSTFLYPASNVSWAPSKISMQLAGKYVTSITLATNATFGCYGTLAEPKIDQSCDYGVVVNGKLTVSPKAQMYVYQY